MAELTAREILREEFLQVMQANKTGESFNLLPSEAAARVAKKYNVTVESVLLSFSNQGDK